MMIPISGGTPGPSISTTTSFIYIYAVSNTVLQLLGIEKPSTTRRFQQTYAGKLIRGADM